MTLVKIGDFARLCRVTVKTLRHYDQIGLLVPAEVDPFTGYRYYSLEQLQTMNRILALRELGFSLDEIQTLLSENLSALEMQKIFRSKQAEIEARINEEQERLRRIRARLRVIEKEVGSMSEYEVTLERQDPMKILSLRDTIPSYADLGRLWGELMSFTTANRINWAVDGQFGGRYGTIYHNSEEEAGIDAEVFVMLEGDVEGVMEGNMVGIMEGGSQSSGKGRVKARDLQGYETVASVIHHGSYDLLGEAYSALFTWIERNGYESAGPHMEFYIKSIVDTKDPEEMVTRIQVPVKKRSQD
jgi:DNA-binding transcriptional MerR regulator